MVRIGDRVEGHVMLRAYAGWACIECGASVKRAGCSERIGYRNASDQADAEYDLIIQQLAPDDRDYVSGRVFVSGTIIPNGADGSPLLNADLIRLADD